MDGISIELNLDRINISVKDIVQYVVIIVTAALFFGALNSKVDNVEKKVDGIIVTQEKRDDKRDVELKALSNQVNTTNLQVELIKQDVERLKESKK